MLVKNAIKVRKDLHVYSPPERRMRRSVRTLIFLRAVSVLLIKVLADLKKRRDALFYRHLGPHGPKEGMPLPPEPLRLTQTALILFILFILSILLQTTEKRATIKPMCVSHVLRNIRKGNPSSGLEALHVYSICRESVLSVGQDRLLLTCLRSGDSKLQMSETESSGVRLPSVV